MSGNSSAVEPMNEHLQRMWIEDQRIVLYKVSSPIRAVIDQWAALAVTTIETWHPSQPYLAIYDLSSPGVGFLMSRKTNFVLGLLGITNEGEEQVQDLLIQRPGFHSKVAVLLSQQHSGYVVSVLSTRRIPNLPDRQTSIFYELDKAVEWLLSS
jgi:hypothetical protein